MSSASAGLLPARGDVGDVSRVRSFSDSATGGQPVVSSTGTVPTAKYEREIKELLLRFLLEFKDGVQPCSTYSQRGYYFNLLVAVCVKDVVKCAPISLTISRTGFISFPISLRHMKTFDTDLAVWMTLYPSDVLVYLDDTIASLISQEICSAFNVTDIPNVRVTISEVPVESSIRQLDPCQIETLVAFKGVVLRVSPTIPEMQIAAFVCHSKIVRDRHEVECGNEEHCSVINGFVTEPLECRICGKKRSFQLNHSRCVFSSKQLIKIQETHECVPEGETPQTSLLYAYDNLIDVVHAGDRAVFIGILKAATVRQLARARTLGSILRMYCDLINIELSGVDGHSVLLQSLPDEETWKSVRAEPLSTGAPLNVATLVKTVPKTPAQMKAMCLAFAASCTNCYETLTAAFAPNIWENADVKKGLLCQLFGGVSEFVECVDGSGKRLKRRGDIHVLLCGDPSTAKSQLVQYVHQLAPRGTYVVGRGTSAAGLTASVSKDSDTRDFVLESGAVVLSDRGICCIDEFDKMDATTRSILHEVMEQQTVSLAKAGIICTLNARTAILASANPVKSKYDADKSVVENINLPSTLLSRFDLIYLVLDYRDEALDRKLAEHICRMYTEQGDENHQGEAPNSVDMCIPMEFLKIYIAFAKSYCFPKLSMEAKLELRQTYVELRNMCPVGSSRALSATPRQLEAMIRLSQAVARMELSENVERRHVCEAARLIKVATYASVMDPLTGKLDFEQLCRGVSKSTKIRRDELTDMIHSILQKNVCGVTKDALKAGVTTQLEEIHGAPLGKREFELLVSDLEHLGILGKTHNGKIISIIGS